jgi:hypothetical protein
VAGKPKSTGGHYPDGFTEKAIDRLIAEVEREVVEVPVATSALVDGSAAERRRRRIEHRILAAVVRSLPSRRTVSELAGEAA